MGDKSGIQWTDATANVVVGCSRVSEGCRHCYAEQLAATRLRHTERYKGLAIITEGGKPQWTGEVRINVDALEQVLRWKKPRRIFLTAMGDPFHESLSDEQIASLFGVMAACPQHTFQVLTKRARRMREWFARIAADSEGARRACIDAAEEYLSDDGISFRVESLATEPWPLPNVELGVSVENQAAADERIPELLATPAAVRFISCEPLLGPVDLAPARCEHCPGGGEIVYDAVAGQCADCGSLAVYWSWLKSPDSSRKRTGIDWVIVGGESGHKARPFDLAWAYSLIEQCKAADVPVFLKQLGARPKGETRGPTPKNWQPSTRVGGRDEWVLRDSHGGDPSEWPEGLRVRELPKREDTALRK
jgi:protein gp37